MSAWRHDLLREDDARPGGPLLEDGECGVATV
jgi:hypothetical protein